MDLASVDLVEKRHQDERVEDHGKVLRGRVVDAGPPPAVDPKDLVSCGKRRQNVLTKWINIVDYRKGIP